MTYQIGDLFVHAGSKTDSQHSGLSMLVQYSDKFGTLIHLRSGNRWREATVTVRAERVAADEFHTAYGPWTPVARLSALELAVWCARDTEPVA